MRGSQNSVLPAVCQKSATPHLRILPVSTSPRPQILTSAFYHWPSVGSNAILRHIYYWVAVFEDESNYCVCCFVFRHFIYFSTFYYCWPETRHWWGLAKPAGRTMARDVVSRFADNRGSRYSSSSSFFNKMPTKRSKYTVAKMVSARHSEGRYGIGLGLAIGGPSLWRHFAMAAPGNGGLKPNNMPLWLPKQAVLPRTWPTW